MTIPQPVLDILEPFLTEVEGNKLKAYRDGAGVWTIGRGHTRGVTPGMVITEAQSDAFLADDMSVAWTAVGAHLGTGVHLTDHEMAALTSFVFNVGINGFSSSNLLKDINQEDFSQIEAHFLAWDHIHKNGKLVTDPGLRNRREKEYNLWCTADSEASTDDDSSTDNPS